MRPVPDVDMVRALTEAGLSADVARRSVEMSRALSDGTIRSLEGRRPGNATPSGSRSSRPSWPAPISGEAPDDRRSGPRHRLGRRDRIRTHRWVFVAFSTNVMNSLRVRVVPRLREVACEVTDSKRWASIWALAQRRTWHARRVPDETAGRQAPPHGCPERERGSARRTLDSQPIPVGKARRTAQQPVDFVAHGFGPPTVFSAQPPSDTDRMG